MTRLANLSSQQMVKALQRHGFTVQRKNKHWRLTDGQRSVSVPHYSSELHPQLVKLICDQAGISVRELVESRRKG